MKVTTYVVLLLLLAGAAFAETVTVAVSKAELRSQPAVGNSTVVKTVTLNTPLNVQKSEGRYLQVKDPKGASGWIHQTLVKKVENMGPGAVVVNNDGVNVRLGPGKDHPVVFKAMGGEAFQVLDQAEGWLQISDAGGRSGWIWKALTSAQ